MSSLAPEAPRRAEVCLFVESGLSETYDSVLTLNLRRSICTSSKRSEKRNRCHRMAITLPDSIDWTFHFAFRLLNPAYTCLVLIEDRTHSRDEKMRLTMHLAKSSRLDAGQCKKLVLAIQQNIRRKISHSVVFR